MSERAQLAALLFVLAGVGAGAWALELRPSLEVDPTALESLPYEIEARSGYDVPVDATVARILEADFHVQRTYRQNGAAPVWLYIGYYGTERGGYTPHTPDACYPAAGWGIDPASRTTRALADGLRANEIQVESAGERRLVQYWYRSHRATGILGEAGQAFDRVVGRLIHGRADGGFVRVSTPIEEGDIEAARQRLEPFALRLDTLLAHHWPEEIASERP
jgi:EpsI family protein